MFSSTHSFSVALEEFCLVWENNPGDVIRGYLDLELKTTNV